MITGIMRIDGKDALSMIHASVHQHRRHLEECSILWEGMVFFKKNAWPKISKSTMCLLPRNSEAFAFLLSKMTPLNILPYAPLTPPPPT
jgi:hypothetical protein